MYSNSSHFLKKYNPHVHLPCSPPMFTPHVHPPCSPPMFTPHVHPPCSPPHVCTWIYAVARLRCQSLHLLVITILNTVCWFHCYSYFVTHYQSCGETLILTCQCPVSCAKCPVYMAHWH